VQYFKDQGEITEVTAFGPLPSEKLSFVLKSNSSNDFQVAYAGSSVTVQVPQTLCIEWTHTGLVGFSETIDIGKGEVISILVEKDFACLDASDIENEDAYPNPNLEC